MIADDLLQADEIRAHIGDGLDDARQVVMVRRVPAHLNVHGHGAEEGRVVLDGGSVGADEDGERRGGGEADGQE